MKDPRNPQGDRPERTPKRPYRKPRLEVYGELGQITGAVGHKGASDNGIIKGLLATR